MFVQIEKIVVGHDGHMPAAGWFLDKVWVDEFTSGQHYVFECHRWLDKGEEDGKTEVLLVPTYVETLGAVSKWFS